MRTALIWMRRYSWLGWLLSLPFWWVAYQWATDRAAPFEVYAVAHAAAQPGHRLDIAASVRRDLPRRCSATFTRWIYDARGYRYDMEGTQQLSAAGIASVDRLTPGELRLSFPLPALIAPGPARLHSELQYRCNPLHLLWPIQVVTDIPFEVLP